MYLKTNHGPELPSSPVDAIMMPRQKGVPKAKSNNFQSCHPKCRRVFLTTMNNAFTAKNDTTSVCPKRNCMTKKPMISQGSPQGRCPEYKT